MKNKKGFTLVELIVVLAVTTILLGTVITVLLQSINMYKIDETKSANQSSLNLLTTSIESKIRSASAVVGVGTQCLVTTPSGTYTYDLNTTTHEMTLNSAYLTGRIASFSCTVTGNTVAVHIVTITDTTGNFQSSSTSLVLRKGD